LNGTSGMITKCFPKCMISNKPWWYSGQCTCSLVYGMSRIQFKSLGVKGEELERSPF